MRDIKDKIFTETRLNILATGSAFLIIFLVSTAAFFVWLLMNIAQYGFSGTIKESWSRLLFIIIFEIIIFWTGIIMVYTTSIQLGIKMRIIGIICGFIPIVHIVILLMIIKTAVCEANFEKRKLKINKKRSNI